MGASNETDDAFVWPLSSVESNEPLPRKGMVWIPEGTLLAGTPPEKIPRLADQELAGEPARLHGFYVDEYPYPNEAGAIPKGGINREEASALCAAQGKRLCTELEWERACKGASNTTYEYGDSYRAGECATGGVWRLSPSGLRVACRSTFGVHDMHGGPWEWTASPWHRGSDPVTGVVRGGNSEAGELVARCANAEPLAPTARRADVGARCCAGEPNEAEVRLKVTRGKILAPQPGDPSLLSALTRALQEKAPAELPAAEPFHIGRVFAWLPAGNDELLVAAGCAKRSPHSACGVGIFRQRSDDGGARTTLLAFASSGIWLAVVKPDHRGRDIWIYGADGRVSFRHRVAYVWGKVAVGEPERAFGRRAE
jgi:hypothetical protein